MKDKVLFDDWSEVKDCNNCENYWNKLCDGTKVGSEKRCTAFKATRKVDIPLELNALRKAVKRLSVAVILLGVVQILESLSSILGG